MDNKDIVQLRKEYMDVPIPPELDFVVRKAFKENRVSNIKKNDKLKKVGILAASIASIVILLTIGVNTNPVFAEALSKVPVVNNIIKVLTFREYIVNEDTYKANIKIPEIQGLENNELQISLNQKYLEENKKLYEEFIKDAEIVKALGGGHLGVDTGYQIKTDNDTILSIGRYYVNTAASSSTTIKYDTIDKKKQILITLPSLFRDDSYTEIISENIKEQMMKQMENDDSKYYWLKDETFDNFNRIKPDQSFYITDTGKLIISFDKYEAAPGYMGTPEFEIPTAVIADILAGSEYIK
ncbi:MAG: anti-sigma factor [Clostridiales bacterium GWB2_37_7]|nr:MAG: anti-sigma factor [Clostridiales bacterium GWB2_37_7]